MGFSPSDKHFTTTDINSNIIDAASGSFVTSLTISGVPVDMGGGDFNLTVKESDGSPTVSNVDTIVVTTGTLTDNGGGQVTISTGGGGGGGGSAGEYISIQDQKSDGTNSGTFTAGTRTRVLNTIVTDDTGQVTLDSNQFTLPAGTYRIWAQAPCYKVNNGFAWLTNITDNQLEVQGCNHYSSNQDAGAHSHSFIVGQFTIDAPKTFEIRHWGHTTYADHGFGVVNTFLGAPEVYTQVQLLKIA